MLNNISIKNFQSHENSFLEFHKGVNSIIGTSNSGKSAILRALNLVINNRPNGESFIRNTTDLTDIKLSTDGATITRLKSRKGQNSYFLNDNEYKAFGQETPDDIKDVLNFSDINFQSQMGSPFLLSETAGEVGRIFNKLVNLEIIDVSISNIEKMKRSIKQEIENIKDSITNTTNELVKYDRIDALIEKLSNIKSRKDKNDIELKKINILLSLFTPYQEIKNKIRPLFQKVKNAKTQTDILSEKIVGYSKDIDKVYKIESLFSEYTKTITHIKHINIDNDIKSKIGILEKKITGNTKEFDKNKALNTLLKNMNTINMDYLENKAILVRTKNELQNIMPEICPLCEREIK